MADKRRLNLSFSMTQPLQREAWNVLSTIPAGQRTDYVCQIVQERKQRQSQEELLHNIRLALREELKNANISIQNQEEKPNETEDIDSNVLGFLLSLQNDCTTSL